jgi:predicted MFS family arabinose efflux permease
MTSLRGGQLEGRSDQRSLIVYTSAAHATVHATELMYAALLWRIGDTFGLDKLGLGLIANVAAFTFGAGALPSGFLSDWLTSRRVLRVCFLTAAVASLLVATAQSTLMLGLFMAALGLCIGLYHPAATSLIAQGARQRGLVLGYHGMSGNIGLALAPALATLFGVTVGWRWAYVFLALMALAMAGLLQVLALPKIERAPASASSLPTTPQRSLPILPLGLIIGAFVMNGFIYRGSMTFLPTLIKEQVHVNVLGIDQAALAGSLTTFALLTGGVGQFLGGRLSDRVPIERLAMQITIIVVPTLLFVGMGGGLLVVVAASVFIFFNFSGQPVFNSLLAEYVPGSALGRGYGLSFFASFGLGSVAATFAGFLADRWGTSSVFLGLAAFSLLTAALATALWRLSTRGALPRAVPETIAPLIADEP